MSPQADFSLVFEELKSILKLYETGLNIKADAPDAYSLEVHTAKNGKRNFSSVPPR